MYLLCWHFCSMSGTNRRQPTGASFHGRHEPASRLGDHSDRFSGLHIASLRSNNCRARDKWWKSQQRHHKQPPVLHSWHGNFYGERDDRRSDVDETPGSRSMQTVNPRNICILIWQCHKIDFLMKSFCFFIDDRFDQIDCGCHGQQRPIRRLCWNPHHRHRFGWEWQSAHFLSGNNWCVASWH